MLGDVGLKFDRMEFFANERTANVIIVDANPGTQEAARNAVRRRCRVDFIRANSLSEVNGYGSNGAWVSLESLAGLMTYLNV